MNRLGVYQQIRLKYRIIPQLIICVRKPELSLNVRVCLSVKRLVYLTFGLDKRLVYIRCMTINITNVCKTTNYIYQIDF